MGKIQSLFLFLFTGLSLNAQIKFDAATKAKEVIYLLRHAKFEGFYQRLDPTMKRYLDVEKVQSIWDGLEMRYGSVQTVGEPKVILNDTMAITLTPIQFEKKKIGLKLVFDKKALIAGMFLEAPTPQYQPASYVDASKFYEYKKVLADPKFPTDAVLSIPNKGGKFPVVIIVTGSGATDKDLTIGPNRIYKDLAWGLSNNGIAVLRYDKRTKDYAVEMSKIKNLTVKDEYLDDLKLAIELVKSNPEIDSNQIFVLGHSEGGYLIPYFEKNLKGIAAYISFAGNYSGLADLLCMQIEYLQKDLPANQKAAYQDMLNKSIYARDKIQLNSPNDSLPEGLTASYLVHLNDNSPEKLNSYINKKRVLFIQGGRDYQVPPSELDKWKLAMKGNTQAEYALFPKLNHIGLEGKGISKPSEYDVPGNVPEEVVLRIVKFIKE
jgi:triacylglycerol esterase/lipase EstA (alpha/beta hydrolase family)